MDYRPSIMAWSQMPTLSLYYGSGELKGVITDTGNLVIWILLNTKLQMTMQL